MAWLIDKAVDLRGLGAAPVELITAYVGDTNAYTWRVTVTEGGAVKDLTGYTVTLQFLRIADASEIDATGTIAGNVATLTIPQACFAYAGVCGAVMRLVKSSTGENTPVCGLTFAIRDLHSDTVVDPGAVVPDLAALLAQMESIATAETGRVTAEGLRVSAEQSRATAEQNRATVEGQRVTAEGLRASAETARAGAETSRGTAEGGRATAETGRVNAENTRAAFYDGFNAQLADIAPDSSGATDPTTSTVGVVKQRYLNTVTGQLFICRAVTGSVYTWEALPLKSVVDAQATDITSIKTKFNTVLLNAFINPRTAIYIEETKVSAGAIYVKMSDFALSLPWTTYTWNSIKTALPTYIKTSPAGIAECIEIPSNYLLFLRGTTFLCRHHSEINRYTDSVIAWCFMGNLIGGLAFDSLQMRISNNISFDSSLTDGNADCIALADRVMLNQKGDSFTFCMVSDSHSDYVSHVMHADSPELTYNRALHMGAYCRVNLNVMGGDILTAYDGTDKSQSKNTLSRYISNFVGKAKSPLALTVGNHDSNTYTTTGTDATKTRVITPHELYLHVGVHNKALTRDANNPEGIYGYYDDPASKIRFFMLNTFDFPLVDAAGDSTKWKYHGDNFAGFQNAQLNWFGDSLESLPEGWAAMVFSHIPPETTVTNGARFGIGQTVYNAVPFFGIVNAFRDGTTYSGSLATGDTPYDVSVNFTTRGAGEFIGFVCGHVPKDNTSNQVGGVAAPEYGYRYISIDGGVRFAIFDIDRATKTIRVYKYGGVNIYDPAMANPPIIGLLAADVNTYGDFVTTYT